MYLHEVVHNILVFIHKSIRLLARHWVRIRFEFRVWPMFVSESRGWNSLGAEDWRRERGDERAVSDVMVPIKCVLRGRACGRLGVAFIERIKGE